MIGHQRDFSTRAVGLLFRGVAVFIGYRIPHRQIPLMPVPTPAPQSKSAATEESDIKTAFQPLRWTLLVAAIFACFIVAMLGFVYLETKHDLTIQSDRVIASQMSVFAHLSPERRR